MPLEKTQRALGEASDYLKVQMHIKTGFQAKVGRVEDAATNNNPSLNLFLYQIDLDSSLKNFSLDQGQPPPLWMVLHYLLTAFDDNNKSDSIEAQRMLGKGMLALQELNFFKPDTKDSLKDNPEPLKITFDSANSELLSKIMQGTDEKYRLSAAFQMRPVMIAPSEPPFYSLPVEKVGPEDQGPLVIPSLGPKLESIDPDKFEPGETIQLEGIDIGTQIEEILLGNTSFPVIAAQAGKVKFKLPADTSLSAGSYLVKAVRHFEGNQVITSNALIGHLLPILEKAELLNRNTVGNNIFGDLKLTGIRLGGPKDSIFVALYQNGRVALMLEAVGTPSQNTLTVTIPSEKALPPGIYFIILRVNGEQARNAPGLNLV